MAVLMDLDLRGLRERAGLKAEKVVYDLGIAMSTLRNWEQGKHQPTMTPEQTRRFLEVYNCTLEELESAVTASSSKYKMKVN